MPNYACKTKLHEDVSAAHGVTHRVGSNGVAIVIAPAVAPIPSVSNPLRGDADRASTAGGFSSLVP
jgi:hypothetical protein